MQIDQSLRASDADREQVAERLRHATAEGRLNAHELEGRLQTLFAARTYGELDALIADLPAARPGSTQRLRIAPAAVVGFAALSLAGLGALTITRLHSAAEVAVAGPGGGRQFTFRPTLADPNDGLILAGSMAVALVVLLVCGVALWALKQSRSSVGCLERPTSGFH